MIFAFGSCPLGPGAPRARRWRRLHPCSRRRKRRPSRSPGTKLPPSVRPSALALRSAFPWGPRSWRSLRRSSLPSLRRSPWIPSWAASVSTQGRDPSACSRRWDPTRAAACSVCGRHRLPVPRRARRHRRRSRTEVPGSSERGNVCFESLNVALAGIRLSATRTSARGRRSRGRSPSRNRRVNRGA